MNLRAWLGLSRRPADDAATPSPAAPSPPPPEPAAKSLEGPKSPFVDKKKAAVRPTVLVTVLGLEDAALARIIETVAAECQRTKTRPLFVTDGSDFSLFRKNKALFEQVIDADACAACRPGRDWQSYALQQYRLIGQKWKPVTMVAFGRKPDPAFLEAVTAGGRRKA